MLNQDWALGRVYPVDAAAWSVAIGLYAREAYPSSDLVWLAMTQLLAAPALLRRGQVPTVAALEHGTPAEVMPRVAAALTAAGLLPRATHGGEVHAVQLQLDRLAVRVELFVSGGLLIARGMPIAHVPVEATGTVLARLAALSARLDVGGVGLQYDHGCGYGWIGQPVRGFDLAPGPLRWLAEHAGSWAEAAQLAALG